MALAVRLRSFVLNAPLIRPTPVKTEGLVHDAGGATTAHWRTLGCARPRFPGRGAAGLIVTNSVRVFCNLY